VFLKIKSGNRSSASAVKTGIYEEIAAAGGAMVEA